MTESELELFNSFCIMFFVYLTFKSFSQFSSETTITKGVCSYSLRLIWLQVADTSKQTNIAKKGGQGRREWGRNLGKILEYFPESKEELNRWPNPGKEGDWAIPRFAVGWAYTFSLQSAVMTMSFQGFLVCVP